MQVEYSVQPTHLVLCHGNIFKWGAMKVKLPGTRDQGLLVRYSCPGRISRERGIQAAVPTRTMGWRDKSRIRVGGGVRAKVCN